MSERMRKKVRGEEKLESHKKREGKQVRGELKWKPGGRKIFAWVYMEEAAA